MTNGHKHLMSLLQPSSLTVIEIKIEAIFFLCNSFIHSLARSLPHLEALSVVPPTVVLFRRHRRDATDIALDGLFG